jgi:hypothetical protein
MTIKLLDFRINRRKPVQKDKALSADHLQDARPEDVFLVLYLMGVNR